MNELPAAIFRRWGHSFEEDAAGVTVYRPAEYEFPRARGRDGIELRPDGTFIDWTIGRGDAGHPIQGRWTSAGPGAIEVTFAGGERSPRTLEVVACDSSTLHLRAR